MKLVTFRNSAGVTRIGALDETGEVIIDFAAGADALGHAASPNFTDMLALIDSGDLGLDLARTIMDAMPDVAMVRLVDVTLLSPVPVPRQMRDCMAFEKHVRQAMFVHQCEVARNGEDPVAALAAVRARGPMPPPPVWFEQPIYYKGNRFSVVGTDVDVIWPSYSDQMDYELEFGIFIGKGGKNIKAEDARAHIFGYTIFNDFSARDTQASEMRSQLGPAKGKDFDTGNAIGPWLVTADEIPDPYALAMSVKINGQERGAGNSGDMHHRFEDMIAWISRDETIHPGEFIGSGTMGDGCGLEQDTYLSSGDLIELEIEGLGILSNRVFK